MKNKLLHSFFLTVFFLMACAPKQEKNFNVSKAVAAIQNQQTATLLQATQSGWDINETDSLGNTVLHYATAFSGEEILLTLLESGADPFLENNLEQTPYSLLQEKNETKKNNLIKQFVYQSWKNLEEEKWNDKHFELALAHDLENIAADFIAHGIPINEPTSQKELAPLVQSVFSGSYQVTQLLLENGAHPNIDFDTRPVITISALFGDLAITQLLVKYGAAIDTFDGPKNTPLQLAADEGYYDLVKFLLEQGANKNLKDVNGEDALAKAIKNKHTEIIELLQTN